MPVLWVLAAGPGAFIPEEYLNPKRIDMKASDHDLEQLFKVEQGHSVAAACRAIYDKGWADAERQVFGHIPGDPTPEPAESFPQVYTVDHVKVSGLVSQLMAVAQAVDSEGGEA